MHSARMLRSTDKYNTDCPILSYNLSIQCAVRKAPGHQGACQPMAPCSMAVWGLCAAVLATGALSNPDRVHRSPERLAAISELRDKLHTMTAEEAAEAFARVAKKHRLHKPPPRQTKIDHFVVLYQENRAADHLLGCANGNREGFDGIPTGGRQLNKVPFDPSGGQVNVTRGTAPYVCGGADAEAEARAEGRGGGQQPLYSTFSGHFKKGTNAEKFPYANQSDEYSYQNGATGGSIQMFSAEQVPIKTAISEHFGVHNRLFCATPTSSTPNHHFTQSGTSCGSTNNNDYQACGGKTLLFPQMAMYDTMYLDNVSFGFYMNSTCDSVEGDRGEHPCNSVGPHTDTSPVYAPDATIAGVARYTDHFYSHRRFYEEAAAGTLPSFSWLNCKEEACDHPCNDIAKGERCEKDVYEALRAGPKWGNTLLLIAHDDAGGFCKFANPAQLSLHVVALLSHQVALIILSMLLLLPLLLPAQTTKSSRPFLRQKYPTPSQMMRPPARLHAAHLTSGA